MPFIEWSPKYSVEFSSIDEQHRQLIKIINDLHDAMKNGKGKEILGTSISNLLDYTKTHFEYEEQEMKLKNYPELQLHSKIHKDLVNQVVEYKKKFDNGETVLTMDIMDFLRNWLLDHIMKTDKKLGSYLKEAGMA